MDRFKSKSDFNQTVKSLRLYGIWKPENKYYRILNTIMIFALGVFVLFQYTDLILSWGQWKRMLRNFSFTFAVMMVFIKIFFFQWKNNHWEELFDLLNDIEAIYITDKEYLKNSPILVKNIKLMRLITIAFKVIVCSSLFFIIYLPVIKYYALLPFSQNNPKSPPQPVLVWTPFPKESGYFLQPLLQIVILTYATIKSIVHDTTVVKILMRLSCQLQLLRLLCTNLGDPGYDDVGPHGSEAEVMRQIMCIQKFHIAILKSCKILNNLQSPVMFVSSLGSSLMLGAIVVSLVYDHNGNHDALTKILFLNILLFQLLMQYWFYNEVTVKSGEVSMGIWESKWWRYGVRVRRSVIVLMYGLNIRIIFKAGPFHEITIFTFITILKTTYSAYAAMTHININND